jgi:proline iminopeptidase
MTPRYPLTSPFATGLLAVGDSNSVYWEQGGNPDGLPVLIIHGGPGSGMSRSRTTFFDPSELRTISYDQRGCGRSTPRAALSTTSLASNTTPHLIADVEALRQYLGIDRWMLFGVSWGSTLALAYAQTHPSRVHSIALSAVTTSRPSEIHWLYHGARAVLPIEWEAFRQGSRTTDPDADLVAAYQRLLKHPDPDVRAQAALDWCRWEDAVASDGAPDVPDPRYADPEFRMAFARIVTHYFDHDAWLIDGQLIANAAILDGIPGVLVHGTDDISAPHTTATELAAAWPDTDLRLIDSAGHSSSQPRMASALVEGIKRLATRP